MISLVFSPVGIVIGEKDCHRRDNRGKESQDSANCQ